MFVVHSQYLKHLMLRLTKCKDSENDGHNAAKRTSQKCVNNGYCMDKSNTIFGEKL